MMLLQAFMFANAATFSSSNSPSASASTVSQSTSLQLASPTFVVHSPTIGPVMPTSTSAQVFYCKLAWLMELRCTNY